MEENEDLCPNCGNELYDERCLYCNPTEYEENNILPENYTPGDPFW